MSDPASHLQHASPPTATTLKALPMATPSDPLLHDSLGPLDGVGLQLELMALAFDRADSSLHATALAQARNALSALARKLEVDVRIMQSAEFSIPSKATLAEAERIITLAVLERLAWNRGATALALGIAPKTLYNKLKAWGASHP